MKILGMCTAFSCGYVGVFDENGKVFAQKILQSKCKQSENFLPAIDQILTETNLSIEDIDAKILKPLMDYLKGTGDDYKILIMPDHPTPCAIRTHSHENVPFAIYDSRKKLDQNVSSFTEDNALTTGFYIPDGHNLLEKLFIEK